MGAVPPAIKNWVIDLVAVGGPSVVIAYAVFKWLGQQWLEQRFKTQLENLKHEQQKEIEQLRHRIQSSFSRISKIHDKEFEVLPKAWFLLHDAYGKASFAIAALRQYPDFALLPEPQFVEFLKQCRLSETEKEALRDLSAPNRSKYYIGAMEWIELNDARTAQTLFHNYLIENRIFMTTDLWQRFGAVDESLASALIDHESWKRWQDWELSKSSQAKIASIAPQIKAIEQTVQQRLEYGQA